MIQAGANVNVANSGGATPLHFASQEGHFEIVKALARAGANVGLKKNNGETAEDVARRNNHQDIANFLSNL